MSDVTIPSWRPQQDRSGLPWMLLAIIGGVLALLAIGGAVVWGWSKASGSRVVPVIEADPRPIKVRPTDAGGLIVPNKDQLVLETPAARKAAERQQGSSSKLAAGPEAPQLEALQRQAAPVPVPAPAPDPVATPSVLAGPTLPPPVALPATPAAPVGLPAKPPAPALRPVAGGKAAVQLAALDSEAAAQAEWAKLAKRVPALAAFKPSVVKIEREGQPTVYRLRAAGLADAAAAKALCDAVKAKGAGCLATGA